MADTLTESSAIPPVKEAARQVIDRLPDQASWDDILYELYVKQKVEAGLAAMTEKKTVTHEDAKRRLLEG